MPGTDGATDRRAPVLVFDLDGTILPVNSFPYWLVFMIGGSIRGIGVTSRLRLSLEIGSLLVRRRLGRLDHAALQRGAQLSWQANAGTGAGERFQAALQRRVRRNLRSLLGMVAAGGFDAVLATAAAADYACEFGKRLGFRLVLATENGCDRAEPRNTGVAKRDRVFALLRKQGWQDRPLIFFTDHIDDLPLMCESAAVCWFGSVGAMGWAKAAAEGADFVYCRDFRNYEMLAALQALDAPLPRCSLLSANTAS